jgi:hypothetical protein
MLTQKAIPPHLRNAAFALRTSKFKVITFCRVMKASFRFGFLVIAVLWSGAFTASSQPQSVRQQRVAELESELSAFLDAHATEVEQNAAGINQVWKETDSLLAPFLQMNSRRKSALTALADAAEASADMTSQDPRLAEQDRKVESLQKQAQDIKSEIQAQFGDNPDELFQFVLRWKKGEYTTPQAIQAISRLPSCAVTRDLQSKAAAIIGYEKPLSDYLVRMSDIRSRVAAARNSASSDSQVRDVDVYVWNSRVVQEHSVGHVMVTEAGSHNVLLSQFPRGGEGALAPV